MAWEIGKWKPKHTIKSDHIELGDADRNNLVGYLIMAQGPHRRPVDLSVVLLA